jgi:hypothetical protein
MFGAAVAAGIATILAMVSLSVSAQEPAPKWGAHIDVEGTHGSKRNIGEADMFLPLMQDGKTLFFGSARLRVADHDNKEGSLGLGVRHMLESGWNIGGYGYYDRQRSESNNTFKQLTFGAEALGRDFDLRGNVYLPQGDHVRKLGTSTAGGTSTASIVGTTVEVTTSGATTFMSEERALKGYDLEAGWRVPIWAAEADKQMRLYAGGYHFSDGGIRVSGPRVRAELAMHDLPGLWKGAQLMLGAEYQDDNARGKQGFVSVRLRFPLGSVSASESKLNWQERRMTAPVVRDVDVVTQARTVSTPSPATVETATATAGGQTLTVLDSATTAGAALPATVAAAGANSTVILSGTFNTTAVTAMQPGQTLMGAGTLTVQTASGRTATLTTPGASIAMVQAGGTAAAIQMANDSAVRGMTVSATVSSVSCAGFPCGGFARGIQITGASNVVIENSTIAATGGNSNGNAFGVFADTTSNVTIRNNAISAVNGNSSTMAVHVRNSLNALVVNNALTSESEAVRTDGSSATVASNSMNFTGGGPHFAATLVNATINPGSTGNVVAGVPNCFLVGTNTGTLGFTTGTCP